MMPFKRLVLVVVGVGGWTLPATPASILTDDPARNCTLPLYHTNQGGTVPESYTSCFSSAGTRLAAVVAGLELLSLAVALPKGFEADGREEATRRDAMIAMATGSRPVPASGCHHYLSLPILRYGPTSYLYLLPLVSVGAMPRPVCLYLLSPPPLFPFSHFPHVCHHCQHPVACARPYHLLCNIIYCSASARRAVRKSKITVLCSMQMSCNCRSPFPSSSSPIMATIARN